MRNGLLLAIAKMVGEGYGDISMMADFSSPKKPKHSRHYVRMPYYSRCWDRREEIYGKKRRNTTRR